MTIRGLSSLDLGNAVSVAMARKSLDVAKKEGAAMVKMVQDAAKAEKARTEPARRSDGGRIDVYA